MRAVVVSAGPGSAIARAVNGHAWTQETRFLADLIDLAAWGNWQRQGKKSAMKPKPVERPEGKPDTQQIGKDPIPIRDFDTWWNTTTTPVT